MIVAYFFWATLYISLLIESHSRGTVRGDCVNTNVDRGFMYSDDYIK